MGTPFHDPTNPRCEQTLKSNLPKTYIVKRNNISALKDPSLSLSLVQPTELLLTSSFASLVVTRSGHLWASRPKGSRALQQLLARPLGVIQTQSEGPGPGLLGGANRNRAHGSEL